MALESIESHMKKDGVKRVKFKKSYYTTPGVSVGAASVAALAKC